MCPFMQFIEGGRRYQCGFCSCVNDGEWRPPGLSCLQPSCLRPHSRDPSAAGGLWRASGAGLLCALHTAHGFARPPVQETDSEASSERPLEAASCGVGSWLPALSRGLPLAHPRALQRWHLFGTTGILKHAGSTGSPPLLLFLRKVLFHHSFFMKSVTKSHTTLGPAFQEPCEHTLPSAFVLGGKVRRWQRPLLEHFITPSQGHRIPSVFTPALNFLHKVIKNPSRIRPCRASGIFVFCVTLWPHAQNVSLKP